MDKLRKQVESLKRVADSIASIAKTEYGQGIAAGFRAAALTLDDWIIEQETGTNPATARLLKAVGEAR